MGVTTIQQTQSPNKQSSKEQSHGGRRGSRSGSSSASTSSPLSSNGQSSKKSSPPSKFTSQLRKLRKRSSTNNNNQTSSQNSSGKLEKKMKRENEDTVGTRQKLRDTSPELKRKHLRLDDKIVEDENARGQKMKEKREDGSNKEDKSDKEKDLKNNNSTNNSSSSRNSSSSNNNTENKSDSSSNSSNLKSRPPVKLTVKFNKSEGGSKKPCQVQVVNSSLSVLPTISSSTSTASEVKEEHDSNSNSNSSRTKDTSESTSVTKSEKENLLEAPVNGVKTLSSSSSEKKSILESKSSSNSKQEKIDKLNQDATTAKPKSENPKEQSTVSITQDGSSRAESFSIELSSSDLVKSIESIGFNEGNISTSLYTQTSLSRGIDPPTKPEHPLTKEELSPPTPCVYVRNKEEAFSPQLFELCLKRPIVLVRNLCRKDICNIDLSLFSTKKLVDMYPNHPVEIRSQVEQVSDENWDANFEKQVWYCTSSRGHTTVGKYAEYQAGMLEEAYLEAEKANKKFEVNPSSYSFALDNKAQRRTIKFGTNCDLSDEKKWRTQLDEINKLPSWARLVSAGNMLSHIGHQILGMNTVQLYMKVPCARTPGHQENNNFCAVNLNIGPGDSEWFGVPNDYWGSLQDICKKNKVDFLHGSWWPKVEELHEAGIPVYRFMQKPGDLVWVNTGCVHWVQAAGWCNNIAWNVGPLTGQQYKAAMERYEWNKTQKYQSIVAMEFLSWNLARNIQVNDPVLFEDLRTTLQQSIRKIVQSLNFVRSKGCKVRFHGHRQHESAHYCGLCEEEVFNVLLIRDSEKRHVVHCLKCAKSSNVGGDEMKGIIALVQYPLKELLEVYDNFQLVKTRPASNEP